MTAALTVRKGARQAGAGIPMGWRFGSVVGSPAEGLRSPRGAPVRSIDPAAPLRDAFHEERGLSRSSACSTWARNTTWSSGRSRPELVLYDSKQLTTHAVCVGMTGSGKTGLCLSLLEEAAIDGIPVIAIDPKGDLGNLLLTFPELRGEDFAPWVDPDEAARQGALPRAVRRADGQDLARGPGRLGPGRRADPAAPRFRRPGDLHARSRVPGCR